MASGVRSGIRDNGTYFVSPADREFFHKNGYVHLPGVMTDEELKEHVDPWYEKYLRQEIVPVGKNLQEVYRGIMFSVMLPRTHNPSQKGNLYELRAKSISEQLYGPGMEIDYDQILCKHYHQAPSKTSQSWHQDLAYWPPMKTDTTAAICWLAVVDTTPDNGCLRFVPGSHKEAELRTHTSFGRVGDKDYAIFIRLDEEAEGVVDVPIRRGDITVHTERTIHDSGNNSTSDWRKGYALSFRYPDSIEEAKSMGFTHSYDDDFDIRRYDLKHICITDRKEA